MLNTDYVQVIGLLKSNLVKENIIDDFRKMHYHTFKTSNAIEQVEYINELLIKGHNISYIAEDLFGVDESTIRKTLNNHGYERKWQFVKIDDDKVTTETNKKKVGRPRIAK